MRLQLPDLQDENILLTVCQYRFLPCHSVHCRVFLAVPSVNSQLQAASIQQEQVMVLCVGAYSRTVAVPAWSSLVRIVMEVDHPDVEWLPTDDIVEQSRTFLYHQIEDVFEGLLDTHTRHRQAQLNAISILENALLDAPAVFVRFVHKFTFYTTAEAERITFQEFLRYHRTYVFAQSPVVQALPGFVECSSSRECCLQSAASTTLAADQQPLLLLTREQVPNVRKALHQKFGEVLAEHFVIAQGGGSPAGLAFLCGAGRYQKVQHDTVARSALAIFADDLKLLQFQEIPQLLVDHLFFSDKKCALAVFQAKSRTQRVRAVAAALQRIGMQDLAARLVDAIPEAAVVRRQSSTNGIAVPSVAANDGAASVPSHIVENIAVSSEAQLNISNRLAALEVWAHSFDSVQVADDSDSSCALTRASELVSVLVKQAVRDYFHDNPIPTTASVAEQPHMSARASAGLQVNEFLLADKIKKVEERLSAMEAKLTAASSVTVFDSPAFASSDGVDNAAAQTRQVQQDQLIKMHTEAISRTWQWTSSVILAMMQQRSTNLHVQQSIASIDERIAALLAPTSSSVFQPTSLSANAAAIPEPVENEYVQHRTQVPIVLSDSLQESDPAAAPSTTEGDEQSARRDAGDPSVGLLEQPCPHPAMASDLPLLVVTSDSD
eukprot:6456441-Amphidinium_carterae.2